MASRASILLLSFTSTATVALAQPQVGSPQSTATQFKAVEQTVEDLGPLSASLRDLQIDFRLPLGFQGVYRVPGQDRLLMRSSGAIYAVFPQSEYIQTEHGVFPMIPAGTVFYIGLPPEADQRQVIEDDRLLRLSGIDSHHESGRASLNDARVNRFLEDGQPTDAGPLQSSTRREVRAGRDVAAMIGPTVANDEEYRAARIAELLQRAAEASSGRARLSASASSAE